MFHRLKSPVLQNSPLEFFWIKTAAESSEELARSGRLVLCSKGGLHEPSTGRRMEGLEGRNHLFAVRRTEKRRVRGAW
jgi:hypothetical protein